jgi:SAM-dependent methyltransferase
MAGVHCRVCSAPLGALPVLAYRNMPGAAQNFPDAAGLANDHGSDLDLFECDECGMIQLTCPPVPYYREVIRAAAFSPEMRVFREKQLTEWVDRYQLGGQRILEIGCGKGEYLRLLAAAGVQATGLEYAQRALSHCRRQGLDVVRGFLGRPSQRLPGAPFAGFMSLNFMEHWPKPVDTLRAMRHNLLPGGIGLVEVPNFDMIQKEGLYSEFISDHLSYFTRETFTFALQRAGFEVLEAKSVWYDYILSAVVRKRQPTDLSSLKSQQDKIGRTLRAFIDRFPSRSVAVWGAGHQALAALALGGLGEDIRYVVDSAPFKQGKFTPATHLPIVPPERLKEDPVQAIIVMAAGYSDEVAKLIRTRHQLAIPVAILRADGLEYA